MCNSIAKSFFNFHNLFWLSVFNKNASTRKLKDMKGSLTLAMGKCLWFSVKLKVCQSALYSR